MDGKGVILVMLEEFNRNLENDLPNLEGYIKFKSEDGEIYYSPTRETRQQITIQNLIKENTLLKAQIKAQSDREEFIEDCIAEMAMQVYSF